MFSPSALFQFPSIFIPPLKIQSIRMHLLHKKCGSRVRNQMVCPVCKVVVERADLVRGFELSKANYVQIIEEELESLEAEANNGIEFREFVSRSKARSGLLREHLLPSAVQRRGETLPLTG